MRSYPVMKPAPLLDAVQAFLDRPKRMLIGGEWLDAATGEVFWTEDPATGATIVAVPSAGAEDVDRAVAAARAAYEEAWRPLAPAARAASLTRLADLVLEHLDELAQIESLDNGKPYASARALDVPFTAELFRYNAGWATKLYGKTLELSLQGEPYHVYTRREPLGVAAGIIPWNFPLAQAAFKIAPALAAGCTIVLKTAEQTPLSALRLAELVEEAGFPAGVVNVLTGFGESAGAALAAHPDVDKISFTGSTEVGKLVLEAAARSNLKRVTLELGGKSPSIVFADADLGHAIPTAAMAIFGNTGQVCNAGSRLFVECSVFDEVVEGVTAHATNLRLGHGLDPETQLGPLVSEAQADRVARYVEVGARDGATVAVGGERHSGPGYFFEPTVLLGAPSDSAVVREEIFGPVLVATPFADVGEIVAAANDTVYGLAASVFTRDVSNAHRLAARLNAGAVWVNCFGVFDPNLPFGGYKQSGIGRENGLEGVEAFTEVKAVTVRL